MRHWANDESEIRLCEDCQTSLAWSEQRDHHGHTVCRACHEFRVFMDLSEFPTVER